MSVCTVQRAVFPPTAWFAVAAWRATAAGQTVSTDRISRTRLRRSAREPYAVDAPCGRAWADAQPAGQGKLEEARKPRQVGRRQVGDLVPVPAWRCAPWQLGWRKARALGLRLRLHERVRVACRVGFLMAGAHIRLGNMPLAWTGRILLAACPQGPKGSIMYSIFPFFLSLKR